MSSNSELLEKIAQLTEEIERMKRQHEEDENANAETVKLLCEQNSDQAKEIMKLKGPNNEQAKRIETLEKRCKALANNHSTNKALERRNEQLLEEKRRLVNEHEKKDDENRSKQRELQDIIIELTKHISELLDQNTKLSEEKKELKKKNAWLIEAESKHWDLTRRLEVAKGHNKLLSASINTKESLNQLLRKEKRELADSAEKMRVKNRTTERELQQRINELTVSQERISALSLECQRLKNATAADGTFDELVEQCSCTICTEIFDSALCVPHLLNCGHTFCVSCITQLTKNSSVSCPTCKRVTNLALRTLATNYFAISVAEQTLKTNFQRNDKCKVCEKTIEKSMEDSKGNPEEGNGQQGKATPHWESGWESDN